MPRFNTFLEGSFPKLKKGTDLKLTLDPQIAVLVTVGEQDEQVTDVNRWFSPGKACCVIEMESCCPKHSYSETFRHRVLSSSHSFIQNYWVKFDEICSPFLPYYSNLQPGNITAA
ncbi:hypothetical protein ATANTOWER_010911 [Ataeniobius toweri]|uniref:Uncharacterized protein n=1 Tax=Ataeniobius toweri TaxID=208326 RepID=A0ABU7AXC3_9TELE|nr:hypothetical protein [Ataeniobius toweri]